jgi:Na+-transporting NADH:ubiquinone oxidoreductase subunit F
MHLILLFFAVLAAAAAGFLVWQKRNRPVTVTINQSRAFSVPPGASLLSALFAQKIFLPSACGGHGKCGFCRVKVVSGGGTFRESEAHYLKPPDRAAGLRLACQIMVRENIRIEVPERLIAIRKYRARCAEIQDLTPDIKRFRFALEDPPEIRYTAGQYVQLNVPEKPGSPEEVSRAYSIASNPADRAAVELIIRRVPHGRCTGYCFDYLRVGDAVALNGPYGAFRLSNSAAPVIFIAGGSGLAPIKSILHQMAGTKNPRPAIFFFGANTSPELFYVREMESFASFLPGYRFVPVLARPEPGWTGESGLVTDAVARLQTDLRDHEAYLCGSPGMIDASIKVLKSLGIKEENIFYDKF